MDINYLLAREQISLAKALSANGREARASHAGLAKAYGLLLAESMFPHRRPDPTRPGAEPSENLDRALVHG